MGMFPVGVVAKFYIDVKTATVKKKKITNEREKSIMNEQMQEPV